MALDEGVEAKAERGGTGERREESRMRGRRERGDSVVNRELTFVFLEPQLSTQVGRELMNSIVRIAENEHLKIRGNTWVIQNNEVKFQNRNSHKLFHP